MSEDGQQPLRRSMRLIGATPLKPMREIMPSEQMARATAAMASDRKSPISRTASRNRSRSRSGSRSGTPSRPRATTAAGGSILKTVVNAIPSDISSSDLLGDTPTARFYNRSRPTLLEDTIVAKKRSTGTTGVAVDGHQQLQQQTVKARRVTRQTSNVFLRPPDNEDEPDPSFSFMFLVKSIAMAVADLPFLILKVKTMPKRLVPLIVVLPLLAAIVYALSQLDWRITKHLGFPLRAPSTDRGQRDSHLSATHVAAVDKGLKNVRGRLAEVEAAINEARAHALGSDEFVRTNVQSMETRLTSISERQALLDARIVGLETDVRQIGSSLVEFQGLTTSMDEQKQLITAMQGQVMELQVTLNELRLATSQEALQNTVRSYLVEALPQQLLVRRAPDGSVQLDASLLRLLHDLFASRMDADGRGREVMSEHSTELAANPLDSIPSASPTVSINWQAVESLLDGKLSSLEHKVVSRDEIAGIISRKLMAELGELRRAASVERATLDGKLKVLEARLPNINDLKGEMASIIEKALISQSNNPLPDGIGMADYALESMGTRVVAAATSDTFVRPATNWLASLLNPYGYGKPPRVALTPDVSLGNCWSFSGTHGNLTIALGSPIIPTHVSLDHVAAVLGVNRSSAPRRFQVYGATGRYEKEILLGSYEYRLEGLATQTFSADFILSQPVQIVKLAILSNHGRPDYTCLYRFRVHSVVSPPGPDSSNNDGDLSERLYVHSKMQ